MVLSVTSVCPNVFTRSLNVPITVKGRPVRLITLPMAFSGDP